MHSANDLKLLTIDAGNTRIKWGLFNTNGDLLESGACLHANLENTLLPPASNIIISNVAGKIVADALEKKFDEASQINWVVAQQNACGIFNGYDNPSQLGADRWAALIGAWTLKKSSCIVVNVGTAVTIDVLIAKENTAEFMGGVILPGLHLLQKNLHQGTAQLPKLSTNIDDSTQTFFGKNTQEAIQYGSIAAIAGAIMQIHHSASMHTKPVPMILLTGGDALKIKKNLTQEKLLKPVNITIEIIEHLVLHGLFRLSNIMQSEAQ